MKKKFDRLRIVRTVVLMTAVCITLSPFQAYSERMHVGKKMLVRASHYGLGDGFDGRTTANCTVFRATGKTAAHKTLPLGTRVYLKNPETGCSEIVTITDRGPFVKGRDIDVASKGVGIPLDVGSNTTSELLIVYIPKEPVMGDACRDEDG